MTFQSVELTLPTITIFQKKEIQYKYCQNKRFAISLPNNLSGKVSYKMTFLEFFDRFIKL